MADKVLAIIINKDDMITVADVWDYEVEDYDYLPDQDGNPIIFDLDEESEAIDWIMKNIKREYWVNNDECLKRLKHIQQRQKYLL